LFLPSSPDATKPVLTITPTALKATATINTNTSVVTFPNMAATDNVTPEPTITCTGNFVGSPRVFLARDATKQTGVFTVSATATKVSCTPRDAAGNAGTTVAFTVTTSCEAGTTLTAGSCTGKSLQGGTDSHRACKEGQTPTVAAVLAIQPSNGARGLGLPRARCCEPRAFATLSVHR
jgi:hypothetical protein